MSPELIGILGITFMLLFMFLGIPITICMASAGVIGITAISGINSAINTVGTIPYTTIAAYLLTVLPVYLLMGEFADISDLMKDSYRAANTWFGGLPGGLAMSSIVGAAFFSAVSGSSMACAALMTRISLPALLDEYKYNPRLATGALCAGGTLGNLIPPGIAFVFYAILSETSIGKLYVAAVIPGVILTLMYLIQIYVQCKLNPGLGPRAMKSTLKQKLFATKDLIALLVIFTLIMGGIYAGIFTATEAGAIGTLFTLVFTIFRKKLTKRHLTQVLKNSIAISGMAFAVIMAAEIFTRFIAVSGVSAALSKWVISLNLSPLAIIIFIMIVYFILGTAMDTITMILLTLPIFLGVVSALGIDLIWFGVLVIIQVELSNISPPVGMNLFVVGSMVKERGIPMSTIFMGVLPFCLTMLVFTALMVAFPQLSLFLTRHM
jgi:tripartite ATP-independent transporter DctM subunit